MPLLAGSVLYAQSTSSSVSVRLYSNCDLHSISIQGYGGLRVSGQRAQGRVIVTVKDEILYVTDTHGLTLLQPSVTVASRSDRWMDLDMGHPGKRRTVGFLKMAAKDGRLEIVNVLPLETYVLGIIEGELGSVDFNPESLKAQIVASRSYVLASRGRHGRDGYDFCDGPHCQVFNGTRSIQPAYKLAMEVSRGEYVAYLGRPIAAYFHDNCGGRTAPVQSVWPELSVPYLQGVRDGDQEPYCERAPRAHWVFHADRARLVKCFRREGWLAHQDALDSLKVVETDPSGRAQQVLIQTNQPLWVSAADFRQALIRYFGSEVLPSTLFSVSQAKGQFTFTGRGWGHGVGLCQWGAIEMAREGKTYREILQHYYPGTEIQHLPEIQYASTK